MTEQENLDYKADWRIGSAITKAFSHMIENGLQYSYITTGEAIIFLRVGTEDPSIVYYHLAVPNEEVKLDDYDWQRTAVA